MNKDEERIQNQRLIVSNILLMVLIPISTILAVFTLIAQFHPILVIISLCFIFLTWLVYKSQYAITPAHLADEHSLKFKTYTGAETLRIKLVKRNDFYNLVGQIYSHYGYQTQIDGNLVLARHENTTLLVQAIRRIELHDLPDVRTLLNSMGQRNILQGVLISTSPFTKRARMEVQQENIQLIELDELMSMIDHIQSTKVVRLI